jgi:hypothetical protein
MNPPPPVSPEEAALAGAPDASLIARTGADWATWLARIDAWGGASASHTAIAAWVAPQVQNDDGKGFWWAQAITVGYERLRGRRLLGQTCDGQWAASKSVTVPGSVAEVRALMLDSARLADWAPPGLQPRPAGAARSVRYTDAEGNTVSAWLTEKPGPRCAIGLQVEGLPSAEARDAAKAAWTEHLGALKALLTASATLPAASGE